MKAAIFAVLIFGVLLGETAICQDDETQADNEWKFVAVTLKDYGSVVKALAKDEPGKPLYLDRGGSRVSKYSRSVILKIEDLPEDEMPEVIRRLSSSPTSKARAEAVYAARMQAAGKVLFDEKWLTPEEKLQAEQAKEKEATEAREYAERMKGEGKVLYRGNWMTPKEQEEAAAKDAGERTAKAWREEREKLKAQLAADVETFWAKIKDTGNVASVKPSVCGNHTVLCVVKDSWHFLPYQIRKQKAQALWRIWAGIHSPDDLDKSGIELQARSGDEIGGSRVWGGSLIWVNE